MKWTIGVIFLLTSTAFAQVSLSPSNMKSQGCNDITQKACRNNKTNICEGVYVANPTATQVCKDYTSVNIENVCGTKDAKIFKTHKECVLSETKVPKKQPKSLSDIKQSDIEQIYTFTKLHKNLCNDVCGARYDKIDVRQFHQTNRKSGVVCLDDSIDDIKNGVKFSDDAMRYSCLETHAGVFKWCINYNKSLNNVDFGAFLQCAGRIK